MKSLRLAWVGLLSLAVSQGWAAEPPPRVAVPRVADLVIDGEAADWGDAGLKVEVLTATAPRQTLGNFDAWARLAWDERGLLILLTVRDDRPREEDRAENFWRGSSVELFLAEAQGGTNSFQVMITPGVTPEQPQLRLHVIDRRADALKKRPLAIAAARTRTADGYLLEALLPWESLALQPAVGMTAAAQLYVNDRDSGRDGAQLLWFPAKAAYSSDTTRLQPIVLAEGPCPPLTTAASGGYLRFRHVRAEVATVAALAGKRVAILNGDVPLGQGTLAAVGRLAHCTLTLPMPQPPSPLLTVTVASVPVATITLPDLQAARQAEFERQELGFRPAVFTSRRFPSADFEQPSLVEDLVGPYTIQTTFYDAAQNVVTTPESCGRYGAVVDVLDAAGGRLTRKFLTLYRAPADVNWRLQELPAQLTLPPEFGIDARVATEQQRALRDYIKFAFRDSLSSDGDGAILLAGLSEMAPGTPAVDRTGPWARNDTWWYALKKKLGEARPLRYQAYVPPAAEQEQGKRWPAILFLHGSGERGDDLARVAKHGPLKVLRELPPGETFPFLVIAPQCPFGQGWLMPQLLELLDEVMARYPIDPDRLYLTGLSMGAYGSWRLACEAPERFAAVVPICGGGDPDDMARLKELPVWVFHGAQDQTVYMEFSNRMVASLRRQPGRVRYTVYPEANHDAWTATYANPALYRWLLAQARGKPAEPPTTLSGAAPSEP